jgi:hypothetical protein
MKNFILSFLLFTTSNIFAQKRVGVNTTTPKQTLDVNGSIVADSNIFVGHKLHIKQGANATFGEATLVAGLVTVFTNKISPTSKVFLSYKKPIFTGIDISVLVCPPELIVDKVSFVIKSELLYPFPNNTENLDNNSELYWWIVDGY